MTGEREPDAAAPALRPGRNPGDAWVEAPSGERFWGRFGAAGILAVDPERGVLLQHRAAWSHHGGTWGIPGGALHEDETALQGALREAHEEAGVPGAAVLPRAFWLADRGVWTYTTVLADVVVPFEPVAGDEESLELRWVPVHEVDALSLHPAFGAAWPSLRDSLPHRPHIIVDAANVVGAVPDGWWHDRRDAAERLLRRLVVLGHAGIAASALGLEGSRWHPPLEAVVEGEARGARPAGNVAVIDASGSGDDAIVARARALAEQGHSPLVVTSDRDLRHRIEAERATVKGARWLLDLLDRARA